MSTSVTIGPLAGEPDIQATARALQTAFGSTLDMALEWIRADQGAFRTAKVGGHVAGCLRTIPMGLYLGARSVPLLGIAGVAVLPEARGLGIAKQLVARVLLDAHEAGTGFSGLYASTQSLYRALGYDQAGSRESWRIPFHMLEPERREPPATILPVDETLWPAVKSCYARAARARDGSLDRGEYLWDRVRRLRGESFQGYALADGPDGHVAGYVFLAQRRAEDGEMDVHVSDIAFESARAGSQILAFLASFSTMCRNVHLPVGVGHPLMALMRGQPGGFGRGQVLHHMVHYVRVLHLATALGGRGFAAGVAGELHLDVSDDLVRANQGRWVLRVEEGRASVTRGGEGSLAIDARGLGGLATGFRTARELVLLGRASGSERALSQADALFPVGGRCALVDQY